MKDYTFNEETTSKEQSLDEDDLEASFMKGYIEEEEIVECSECGSAIAEEGKITKKIEGEEYAFCSELCAKEFVETMGSD